MKITETKIEQYVRFPEELSAEELRYIKQQVAQSSELQELVDFFTDYYEVLNRIEQEKSGKDTVIELKPFNYQPENSTNQKVVLAAMTGVSDVAQLQSIATLASEEHGILVRILHDHRHKQYRIHIIEREQPQHEYAILTIEDINTDFVLDEEGKITFTPSDRINDLNWQNVEITYRTPVEKKSNHLFESDKEQEDPNSQLNDTYHPVIKSIDGTVVTIDLEYNVDECSPISRILVKGNDSTKKVVRVHNKTARCTINPEDKIIDIWLFH